MDFAFSEEQDEFREMVRRFFEEKASSADVRRVMATPEGYDPALWKQMAVELGVQGVHLPESVGGQGFGFLELGIVFEEMGRVVLPSPLLSSAVLGASAIRNAGSDEEQAALLPGIASGEHIYTLAWAEGAAGWKSEGIAVTATPDGDSLVLDGLKTVVTDAAAASHLVVAARLPGTSGDEGVTLATIETGAAGVEVTDVAPLDPTRHQGTVALSGARARPLGPPGRAAAALERTALEGCVALSAELVGVAQRSLEMAVEYAKVRLQFARPIGSFQAIKHKAAEVLTEVELARSAAYWAWWVADQEGENLAEAAHLAKAATAEAAHKATTENVQIHGGIGFTWEHDAHLYFKRARSADVLLGDATTHRAALADTLGV